MRNTPNCTYLQHICVVVYTLLQPAAVESSHMSRQRRCCLLPVRIKNLYTERELNWTEVLNTCIPTGLFTLDCSSVHFISCAVNKP